MLPVSSKGLLEFGAGAEGAIGPLSPLAVYNAVYAGHQ